MNTCHDCKNDLVCHDQGECLRPTPETEIYAAHKNDVYEFVDPEWDWVVSADSARRLERERNDARELLASEKATRNAIIAKGIETERQLAEAREANARLREALENCREDSIELLGERDWWKEEPRCGYQKSYAQTAKNIQIADALLTP